MLKNVENIKAAASPPSSHMHSDICLSLRDKGDLRTEMGDPAASEKYYTTRNTHTLLGWRWGLTSGESRAKHGQGQDVSWGIKNEEKKSAAASDCPLSEQTSAGWALKSRPCDGQLPFGSLLWAWPVSKTGRAFLSGGNSAPARGLVSPETQLKPFTFLLLLLLFLR